MPVQIDEVIITTTVNPQASTANSGGTLAQAEPIENERELAEKILQIIREKTER